MSLRLEKPKVEGLQVQELLGKGNFGEVWRATPAISSKPDLRATAVAIKVFKPDLELQTSDSKPSTSKRLLPKANPVSEIATWQHLTKNAASNPRAHIVHMGHVYTASEDSRGLRRQCVTMELCRGGTLQQLLDDTWRGVLNEQEAATLARRVAEALSFCHAHGVLHLDVTPKNVLFAADRSLYPTWTPDGRLRLIQSAKLADFGLSCHVTDTSQPTNLGGFRGTLSFMAPEVFTQGTLSSASDAWGLGAMLLLALVGVSPPLDIYKWRSWSSNEPHHDSRGLDFDMDLDWVEKFLSTSSSTSTSKSLAWCNLSSLARKTIKGLLCIDPNGRLSLEELLQSPWLQKHMDS